MPKAKPTKNIPIKKTKDSFFMEDERMDDEANSLFNEEGQLCCDVYQDDDNIIVKSTIAGVDPKNLDISVANDLLTIRGHREDKTEVAEEDFFAREVYWGTFSRSIVLPQEVDQTKTKATLKNGILTIQLPKKYSTSRIRVKDLDEEE